MAGSNWDTLTLDLDGIPCNGTFDSPMGVVVDVYKNTLEIREHIQPNIIVRLTHGSLTYKDVSIRAIRGPQGGIYFACWTTQQEANNYSYAGMVGCGVFGFDASVWVGVTPRSVAFLKKWLQTNKDIVSNISCEYLLDEITNKNSIYCDSDFCTTFINKIVEIKFDNAKRFNQEDASLAKEFGTNTPRTNPGEAKLPILDRILKDINDNLPKTN